MLYLTLLRTVYQMFSNFHSHFQIKNLLKNLFLFQNIKHFLLYFQIHDDLEKEPEYSGSGFGPDDEDSSSSHHTPHHSNTNNRKDQDLELGSGDDGDNDDDDEDITTDTKHQKLDPTTTDDEDVDSQCMALFYLFFNLFIFHIKMKLIYDENLIGYLMHKFCSNISLVWLIDFVEFINCFWHKHRIFFLCKPL